MFGLPLYFGMGLSRHLFQIYKSLSNQKPNAWRKLGLATVFLLVSDIVAVVGMAIDPMSEGINFGGFIAIFLAGSAIIVNIICVFDIFMLTIRGFVKTLEKLVQGILSAASSPQASPFKYFAGLLGLGVVYLQVVY